MDKPLALKLAPVSMDDIVGQRHLIGKDKIQSLATFQCLAYPKFGICFCHSLVR